MNKMRLVRIGWTDLNSHYIEWVLREYFDLTVFDKEQFYTKDSDILVISRLENYDLTILKQYLDQGFKLLIINLWEARPYLLAKEFESYLDNILVVLGCENPMEYGWKQIVSVPRWFWYNESLWYTFDKHFQYQNYIPNRTNNKLFFMPIKRNKPFRTFVVKKLNDMLGQAIWSYVESQNGGKYLTTREDNPVAKVGWDRQFESEWYNDTYFTVAVETYARIQTNLENEINGSGSDEMGPCDLFVTEKTYKPIAHQHPFMICGMKGILKFLKKSGFETYDHIFDESYDNLDFFEDRVDVIYNNIKQFSKEKYADPLTEQKIRHNYNRFYDKAAVLAGVKLEFIDPLLEWVHST